MTIAFCSTRYLFYGYNVQNVEFGVMWIPIYNYLYQKFI